MKALTPNQKKVLGVLQETDSPLSAYAILDQLRSEGLKAPLQVYRALDKLIALGHVHRLESLNAFTACCHPDHTHNSVIFTICEACDLVTEVHDNALDDALHNLTDQQQFKPRSAVIELRGLCQSCQG